MQMDFVRARTARPQHRALLRWALPALAPLGDVHGAGGAVVMMPRFDPEEVLALIERYRATHSQFVPTMFVRML
jgi:long-chain acyl-CoA synthetase